VAAGFRSPLFVLGIGVPKRIGFNAPIPIPHYGGSQGKRYGFRTPVPIFNMGTAPAVNRYGFRTPLPFWNIGTTEYIPPPVEEVRRGGTGIQARLLREDEEILAVIMAYMSTKH
jgi:hypothetical protein